MNLESEILRAVDEFLRTEVVEESSLTLMRKLDNKPFRVFYDLTPQSALYVIKNTELKGVLQDFGGILYENESCLWDRDLASHNEVASQMGYGKNFIGFYVIREFLDEKSKIINHLIIRGSDYSGMAKTSYKSVLEGIRNSELLRDMIRLANAEKEKFLEENPEFN
jgi:hypothetical protein